MSAYRSSLFRIATVGLFSVSLAACGASGGSSVTPAVAQGSAGGTSTASVATMPVQITVGGTTSTASADRSPMYFSPSTSSMTIAVAQGTGSPVTTTVNCSSACSGTVQAPLGNDTFTVSLFDGNGHMLSSGSGPSTIKAGVANAVALTLSGVVMSVALSAPTAVELGVSGSQNITVTAMDYDGHVITGSYFQPVTIADSDSSGATSLSTTSITASGSSFAIKYNGSNSFTGASFTASAPGMPTANAPAVTLSPSNVVPVSITAS